MGPFRVDRVRIGRRQVVVLAWLLAWLVAGSALVVAPAGRAAAQTPRELTGTLPNGTSWRAVVPEAWSGTLLLYGHTYIPGSVPGPPLAQTAPDAATQQALLDRGYALAGSSYSQNGWAMETAAQDQLDALAAAGEALLRETGRAPTRVLAWGSSMGGLVTGQLAERAAGAVDGALPTCGLMAGGLGVVDYQIDGAHAVDQLLAPNAQLDLAGYASREEAATAGAAFVAAVDAGQQTPAGRARVALAAALFHVPEGRPGQEPPAPGDHEARQAARYANLRDKLSFVFPGRFDIETEAGGNPATNVGVDYRRLLRMSADRGHVAALYRQAGLDLGADLDQLTRTAATAADPGARAWLARTSTVSGRLAMPVLSLHTTNDNIAAVQYEEEYRETVLRAGHGPLLRQAFVARTGHCAFTPAELVASIQALDQRVQRGHWGHLATPPHLDAAAELLGLGASAIIPFHPAEWLADRAAGPSRRFWRQ